MIPSLHLAGHGASGAIHVFISASEFFQFLTRTYKILTSPKTILSMRSGFRCPKLVFHLTVNSEQNDKKNLQRIFCIFRVERTLDHNKHMVRENERIILQLVTDYKNLQPETSIYCKCQWPEYLSSNIPSQNLWTSQKRENPPTNPFNNFLARSPKNTLTPTHSLPKIVVFSNVSSTSSRPFYPPHLSPSTTFNCTRISK